MKSNPWLVALLVIVLALLVALVFQLVRHSNDECNYNNPTRSYVKTTPSCMINFMCTQGHTAFKDACGCGCQSAS